jgi:uncharacterized protein YuzE
MRKNIQLEGRVFGVEIFKARKQLKELRKFILCEVGCADNL